MRPFLLLAPLVVTLVAGCQADAPVALDPDPMAATIVAADVEAAALEAARAAVLTVAPSASTLASGGVDLVAGAIENPRAVAASPGCGWTWGPDRFECADALTGGATRARAYRAFIAGESVNAILGAVDSVLEWQSVSTAGPRADGRRATTATLRDSAVLRVLRRTTDRGTMRGMTVARAGAVSARATTETADGTREVALSGTSALSSLWYAAPEAAHPYPLQGTLAVTLAGAAAWRPSLGADASVTPVAARVELTFDGTRAATVRVGALRCAIDLADASIGGCWR
jgi:hypothetical protein